MYNLSFFKFLKHKDEIYKLLIVSSLISFEYIRNRFIFIFNSLKTKYPD